jgi:hypothetical protein
LKKPAGYGEMVWSASKDCGVLVVGDEGTIATRLPKIRLQPSEPSLKNTGIFDMKHPEQRISLAYTKIETKLYSPQNEELNEI